jgi:hypothetical protein
LNEKRARNILVIFSGLNSLLAKNLLLLSNFCVRDAEGGGERSEPPALPCLRLRWSLRWAKPEAISCGIVEIPLRLLHFVRNDDKARIVRHLSFLSRCSRMCLNYRLSTFTEAIAKPGAARPEHNTAD